MKYRPCETLVFKWDGDSNCDLCKFLEAIEATYKIEWNNNLKGKFVHIRIDGVLDVHNIMEGLYVVLLMNKMGKVLMGRVLFESDVDDFVVEMAEC